MAIGLYLKKCMCPFLNYFKNYVNYFLVLLSYLLHPWKKNTVKVMQFRSDEKNGKPPRARNVTTFFFCLALTYCVLTGV